MAGRKSAPQLSRRERQIMDVIYSLGKGSVSDVVERLPDPPSYSSVRALLRILEDKGHLRHEQDGARYLYAPTVSREKMRRSALRNLVSVFFGGSVEETVAALLSTRDGKLSEEELERIAELVRSARDEEKAS
jgi:predicted transcriptional regulator